MNLRRCPSCNQPLPADSDICGICEETTFTVQAQEKLTSSASSGSPRALDLRYRPLSESTNKNWARSVRSTTSTLEPEYEHLSDAHITNLKQDQILFRPLWKKPGKDSNYRFPPKIFFWISTFILLALAAGGAFGVAITLGHGNASGSNDPILQITPSQADRGALISLRGSHFSPRDVISLTRDINIPLTDTAGKSLIQADDQGNFSDTALIDDNWSAGTHSIHAEDALLHKIASFPLDINGHGLSQRPPHLFLSASALDFGAGDPATNSTKIVILSNSGGGKISWSAHSDQSWLQFSPQKSSFTPNNNPDVGIVIAADRTDLAPGNYQAHLSFVSNAGQASITVKMSVIPFNPGEGPIFQVSPPVMSFTSAPNGSAPSTQALTIANPGNSDLQWTLNTATDNGGSWLTSSSANGNVAAGDNQQVQISIKPGHLPLGTYKGHLNLKASGTLPVQDNTQTIYVTLTIQPQCSLQASASSLSFNVGGKQPVTASQSLNIAGSSSCKAVPLWSASASTKSGGNWLTLSSTSGTTPANLNITANGKGLAAGTYAGTLKVSDNNNAIVSIAVSLTVANSGGKPPPPPPPPPAHLVFNPASLSFSGNPDQGSLSSQTFTLKNSGGEGLNWHASSNATWLQLSASTGTLNPGASKPINATATTTGLASGDHTGAITLSATNTAGKTLTGGTINVVLHVLAPCTFTTGSSQLNFTATAGSPNPSSQSVSLTASAGCSQNVQWSAQSPDGWVTLAPGQGSIAGGGSGSISVGVDIAALVAQGYTSQVNITATDTANGQSLGSIPPITVNLQVQAPTVTGTGTPTADQTPTATITPVSWMLIERKDQSLGT